ncbi:hypothetical protein K3495_g1075 [Podosphaera aphanis]|nr:hypothetical protein K3495_g1075 [Podosphaera aphanis]
MDKAFNKHAPFRRDTELSSQTLDDLSLAPLTSRLPRPNPESSSDSTNHISHFQPRSAPTTPPIFDHHSRSKLNTPLATVKQSRSSISTPSGVKSRKNSSKNTGYDAVDTDWFLRASVAMLSSARESKGQTWLVSRASSTSLTLPHHEEYKDFKSYHSKENNFRRSSRKGSIIGEDDQYLSRSHQKGLGISRPGSGTVSQYGSRIHSRSTSSTQLWIPPTVADYEGYFDYEIPISNKHYAGPDFVNLEEDMYFDQKQEEATIRELARSSSQGISGWIEKTLGWSLFTIARYNDDDDDDDDDGVDNDDENEKKTDDRSFHPDNSPKSPVSLDNITESYALKVPPAPKDGDVNVWQDAAWILSVAAQTMFQ